MGRFLSKVSTATALLILLLFLPSSLNQETPVNVEAAASAQTAKQVALQSAPSPTPDLALNSADVHVEVPRSSDTATSKTISTEPHHTTEASVQPPDVQAEKQ